MEHSLGFLNGCEPLPAMFAGVLQTYTVPVQVRSTLESWRAMQEEFKAGCQGGHCGASGAGEDPSEAGPEWI